MLRLIMRVVNWQFKSSGNRDINTSEYIRSVIVENVKKQNRYQHGIPFPPEDRASVDETEVHERPRTRSQGAVLEEPEEEDYDPKNVKLAPSKMIDLGSASKRLRERVFGCAD